MARQLAQLGRFLPIRPATQTASPRGAKRGRRLARPHRRRAVQNQRQGAAGEFEAFLREVDQDLLARVQREVGTGRKPAAAALFAAEHPSLPEILDMYRKIAEWFGPDIVPASEAGTTR